MIVTTDAHEPESWDGVCDEMCALHSRVGLGSGLKEMEETTAAPTGSLTNVISEAGLMADRLLCNANLLCYP